jgi:uncharacterized protein YwqG
MTRRKTAEHAPARATEQNDMSTLDEFKRANTRTASVVEVGGFRPSNDPAASNFGLTPLALPNEAWPEHEGRPLLFVCQLNLSAAPFVPELVRDVGLLTFFVKPDLGRLSQTNGADWQLRAYPAAEGLVPLPAPPNAPKAGRGFECCWQACADQPVYDDPERVVPPGFDPDDVHLDNVRRTKVGGYASNIQSEPWWGYRKHPAAPRYCLQINSEPKVGLVWGDSGTIYLARGTAVGFEREWFLDWQCY